MTIDDYVARVGLHLSSFGPLALGPLREVREHLVDARQSLIEDGLGEGEAEQEAVRRFGDAKEIGQQLAAALSDQRSIMERIVKIISATNVFTAVWGFAAVALLNPTSKLLIMTSVVGLAVVACAVVCLRRNPDPGALFVSGVAVTAVGSAGVLWALMPASMGQVAQLGLAALMLLYLAQGTLAIWAGARRSKLESELAPE